MKKLILSLILMLILLLPSCMSKQKESAGPTNNATTESSNTATKDDIDKDGDGEGASNNFTDECNNTIDTEFDVRIESPMTLSNNQLYSVNGKDQELRFKMIKGTYFEDWTPGPLMGNVWTGDFIFELVDSTGKIISQTNLGSINNQPIIFNSFFNIAFDDYNNDGDIDFTVGQYASSNGNDYRLFTIRDDGSIEELLLKGQKVLYISGGTGRYSTKLTKIDEITFQIEYYDMAASEYIPKTYTWDGDGFIRN